jgi:uncharacterized FlaG/YvyC family protein
MAGTATVTETAPPAEAAPQPSQDDIDASHFAPDFMAPDESAATQPISPVAEAGGEAAPAAAPAGDGTATNDGATATDTQDPPEGQAPASEGEPLPSAEDLQAIQSENVPTDIDKLRIDRDASATEARKLNEAIKTRDALLADQGLKVEVDADGTTHLVDTKHARKGVEAKRFEDMPKDVTEKLDELLDDSNTSARQVFEHLSEAIGKPVVVPAKTTDAIVRQISPERADAAMTFMVENKSELYPEIEAHRALIKAQIEDLSPAMKRAYHDDPEAVIGLVAANVAAGVSLHRRRQEAAIAAEDEKTKQAEAAAATQPAPTGGPVAGDQGAPTATLTEEQRLAPDLVPS